ncbi:IgaA/UmoB family intracellular growth attenuator [Sinomicrobium sp. M5D2P17]
MDVLYYVLLFGVLIYSLVNAITYLSRRSRDRSISREAEKDMELHRKLTPEECELLDRLQKQKGPGKKIYKRTGDDVYVIKGLFDRHGITTRYNTEWHNMLGGLEVTLEDEGLNYVQEINMAEVVKTEKNPLVLTLNGRYSLSHSIHTKEQMEKGETGKLPGGNEEGTEVRLISNRNQTLMEIEAVEKAAAGMGGVLLLSVAFFLLGLSVVLGQYAHWGVISGISFLLYCLWRIWRAPRWPSPAPVRVLHGVPTFLAQLSNASSQIEGMVARMGSFELKYNRDWLPFMLAYSENPVNAEVTKDGWLMRFGPHLSLGEEEKKFPSVRWFRHVAAAIVGAVTIVLTLVFSSGISENIQESKWWIQGASADSFAQAWEYMAPSFLIISGGILLLIHIPLALNGYIEDKKRKQKIRKYYSGIIYPDDL